MHIRIKQYEPKDNHQIKHLMELCFEDDALLSILNTKHLQCAYSAFIENQMVGFVLAWKSRFHPYCTYFRIVSHPMHRTDELNALLLSKVKDHSSSDKPLQTSVWETSSHTIHFFKKNGFKEIRRTYSPKLAVANLTDYLNTPNTQNMRPLGDMLTNTTLMNQLIVLVQSVYEKTHRVNPVASLKDEEWKELILTDDIILEGSYLYLDEQEKTIMAYSFLHTSDRDDALELGWCGAVHDQATRCIPELVFHQIQYAKQHGVRYLMGEFDTTDPYSMTVFNQIPFTPAPTWITFQN